MMIIKVPENKEQIPELRESNKEMSANNVLGRTGKKGLNKKWFPLSHKSQLWCAEVHS